MDKLIQASVSGASIERVRSSGISCFCSAWLSGQVCTYSPRCSRRLLDGGVVVVDLPENQYVVAAV